MTTPTAPAPTPHDTSPDVTGQQAFDAYAAALTGADAPILGHLVLYSIFDGEVTRDDLARWFTELRLDPQFVPAKLRPVDAYERVTGPDGVRVSYPLPLEDPGDVISRVGRKTTGRGPGRGVRQGMAPDERQQRTHGNGAIDRHCAGGGGNVNEQDQHRAALLVIRRRRETQIERHADAQRRGDRGERQHHAGQAHELVRVGVTEQPVHVTTVPFLIGQVEADAGGRREGT